MVSLILKLITYELFSFVCLGFADSFWSRIFVFNYTEDIRLLFT